MKQATYFLVDEREETLFSELVTIASNYLSAIDPNAEAAIHVTARKTPDGVEKRVSCERDEPLQLIRHRFRHREIRPVAAE
ncbi:MAG: hypothetical protein AAFX03_13010 [Pseudomonadota bacterium]